MKSVARGSRSVLERAADDLVVNIRDVAHVGHLVTERAQPPLHDVEHDHHARVTDMAIVVYGHPADVHPYDAILQRHESLLVTRERVVDAQ
jgi:hypothetical protein